MSTQGGSSSVWVWCPVEAEKGQPFQHPSDVPTDDPEAAKVRFVKGIRGPRLARISPATLLQSKGNLCLIAERGATREVPKPMVLPWYEGLLLLEEIATSQGTPGQIDAAWCDGELRKVLEQERAKFRNGQLSGTLYMEKRLVMTAVTGARFVDNEDKEYQYRREGVRGDDVKSLVEGEDSGSFFRIREITGYLPPWEAFCHEKCGFYQDFYQVQWEHPFSEVDYSSVENGCMSVTGATWEPDECLPAHLDPLRLAAKRAWIKRRREQENSVVVATEAGVKRARGSPEAANGVQAFPGSVKKEEDKKPMKIARLRRDGIPLEQDLFRSKLGHDFSPDEIGASMGNIRTGWPKHPQDYPPGFAVANPPGFCWEGCDCMDDQRPQRPWETHKAWLEDSKRTQAANAAVETFSAQTRFVRRRGMVTKMCYFESPAGKKGDPSHPRAALGLAKEVESALGSVLQQIPLHTLSSSTDLLQIPAKAFLSEENDYEPLRFDGAAAAGGPLPPWAKIESDTGRLFTEGQPPQSALPLRVEFTASEGCVGAAECSVVTERHGGLSSPWAAATVPIIQLFNDLNLCPLEKGARAALLEHFSQLWDFRQRSAKNKSLAAWVETMAIILRMLRSTAVGNITLSSVHRTASTSGRVLKGSPR